jgi:hypothetical protein
MIIEKSGFLLMAGTLAAGGVGGWFAHDAKTQRARMSYAEPPLTAVPIVTASAPVVEVASDRIPLPPLCDDSVGTAGDCPAMGPAEEGVCSNFAAKRCAEYKTAFKPKVAQSAVACLKSLTGNALCDASRVNLCGHAALMSACPEPTPDPSKANAASAAPPSPVVTACDNIIKACSGQALTPSSADCRQTLSGMSDFGRASMVECMATHCGDKGLLGCEAVKKP